MTEDKEASFPTLDTFWAMATQIFLDVHLNKVEDHLDLLKKHIEHTVDGRNPAPVEKWFIPFVS